MSETATEESDSTPGVEVLSPMPGTFYRAPSPEDPPFVKEGDSVKKGDPLCIIEAMKIMNEIEVEDNGVIQKILVKSEQAVEFNQPLFILEPN
jgi:acetyl-CoA carboxylase biotin carboxyl carrier protein